MSMFIHLHPSQFKQCHPEIKLINKLCMKHRDKYICTVQPSELNFFLFFFLTFLFSTIGQTNKLSQNSRCNFMFCLTGNNCKI